VRAGEKIRLGFEVFSAKEGMQVDYALIAPTLAPFVT
jgi:hypothetical protein